MKVKKNEFKKEIKKIRGKTKEMKKEANTKRDEQKQEVMRKGWKKNLMKEKHKKCFVSREIRFKKHGRVFLRKVFKNDKTNKKGICSQKCFSAMEERRKKEKNPSEKKKLCFVRFFYTFLSKNGV